MNSRYLSHPEGTAKDSVRVEQNTMQYNAVQYFAEYLSNVGQQLNK